MKSKNKITIETGACEGLPGDWYDMVYIVVSLNGEIIVDDVVGGGAEDNSFWRDYDWIVPAFEELSKKLGCEVELKENYYD